MIKHVALAGLLSTLLAGQALAQTAAQPGAPAAGQTKLATSLPETADDCLKTATDLAVSIDDKKLAEEKLDKIDDLLTRMESHCDAKQFSEAMAVARDIKVMIDGQ